MQPLKMQQPGSQSPKWKLLVRQPPLTSQLLKKQPPQKQPLQMQQPGSQSPKWKLLVRQPLLLLRNPERMLPLLKEARPLPQVRLFRRYELMMWNCISDEDPHVHRHWESACHATVYGRSCHCPRWSIAASDSASARQWHYRPPEPLEPQ